MRNSFDALSDSAKIWIYQSDRNLSDSEVEIISNRSEEFVKSWAAHGNALASGAKIFHHYFLVLAVDEQKNQASGCSIDSSVRFIRQLEEEFKISLLDRSRIAVLIGNNVTSIDFKQIKSEIETNKITGETLIFNNLVATKKELQSNWMVPAKNTWLKKYFKQMIEKV